MEQLPYALGTENLVIAGSLYRFLSGSSLVPTTWRVLGEQFVLSRQWMSGNAGSSISKGITEESNQCPE